MKNELFPNGKDEEAILKEVARTDDKENPEPDTNSLDEKNKSKETEITLPNSALPDSVNEGDKIDYHISVEVMSKDDENTTFSVKKIFDSRNQTQE